MHTHLVAPPPERHGLELVCQVLQVVRSRELLGVEVVGSVAGVALVWRWFSREAFGAASQRVGVRAQRLTILTSHGRTHV